MGLEGLLLEDLRFGAAGAKCWVGDREIDASRELIPKVETDHTSTLALTLNSCTIILDPGLIDRTYLLLNYADLDPVTTAFTLTPIPRSPVHRDPRFPNTQA